MSTNQVKELLAEFKGAVKGLEKHADNKAMQSKCAETLAKLKIAMLDFDVDSAESKSVKEQLTLQRESLELATIFSVMTRNAASFERHIAQVKVIYRDYSSTLLESPRKWTILGLNLMHLLATNKLSEFHTELELIPVQNRKDVFISYPIEVEQRLMEGSYRKVLSSRKSAPSTHYAYFMDILGETVRERISECSMKAYDSIPVSEGKKLLLLESDAKVKEYAAKRGWSIKGQEIHWNQVSENTQELKSRDFIKESLSFATELERIV